jgi:threonine dehydratase
MSMLDEQFSTAKISAVATRIAPYVRRTPVLWVQGEDFALPGVRIAFKFEFTQHAGSFKSRGAFCQMLTREAPPAGVLAASGGNHGVAVAYAARQLNIPATIFVPSVASPAKIEQIKAFGATLQVVGERYADALAASVEYASSSAPCRSTLTISSKHSSVRRPSEKSSKSRPRNWTRCWSRSVVVA